MHGVFFLFQQNLFINQSFFIDFLAQEHCRGSYTNPTVTCTMIGKFTEATVVDCNFGETENWLDFAPVVHYLSRAPLTTEFSYGEGLHVRVRRHEGGARIR